jgi:peptidoglycan biosynthesis protein MviN/MurJ (putative lipid II flippase)
VIVGGLTLSDGAFGAILSTTENQAGRVAVAFFSLIASAVGALALVPTYGLMGAAISFATAKLIGFSILVIIVVRTLDVQLPMREIVRLFGCAAVAGLAAAGIAWFVPGLVGGSIAGLVYAAVFGAFSIILDSWHTEDVAQLLSVTRRFPRLLGWFQPSVMKWLARLEQRSPSTT